MTDDAYLEGIGCTAFLQVRVTSPSGPNTPTPDAERNMRMGTRRWAIPGHPRHNPKGEGAQRPHHVDAPARRSTLSTNQNSDASGTNPRGQEAQHERAPDPGDAHARAVA